MGSPPRRTCGAGSRSFDCLIGTCDQREWHPQAGHPGRLGRPQSSISSLRFSRRFLLIPIDREAPSYQPLDLSLAVRLVFFFLAVADVLSFGACTTVRSFLDMYRCPLDKRTPVLIAMALVSLSKMRLDRNQSRRLRPRGR